MTKSAQKIVAWFININVKLNSLFFTKKETNYTPYLKLIDQHLPSGHATILDLGAGSSGLVCYLPDLEKNDVTVIALDRNHEALIRNAAKKMTVASA